MESDNLKSGSIFAESMPWHINPSRAAINEVPQTEASTPQWNNAQMLKMRDSGEQQSQALTYTCNHWGAHAELTD